MAEERKIVIEILDSKKDVGSDSKGNKEKNADEQFSDALNKILHPVKTAEKNTIGKNVIVMQTYQQAKQQVITAVSFYHNRYFSLKEDYLAENTYNNAKTAIGKATGFLGSVTGGAIAGASLGPYGALAGAVIGAVGFGINEQINKMQTISTSFQQLNASNMQTSFLKTRAGLNDNNKNTEN